MSKPAPRNHTTLAAFPGQRPPTGAYAVRQSYAMATSPAARGGPAFHYPPAQRSAVPARGLV